MDPSSRGFISVWMQAPALKGSKRRTDEFTKVLSDNDVFTDGGNVKYWWVHDCQ